MDGRGLVDTSLDPIHDVQQNRFQDTDQEYRRMARMARILEKISQFRTVSYLSSA